MNPESLAQQQATWLASTPKPLEYAVDFGGRRGVEPVPSLTLARALVRIDPTQKILARPATALPPWEPIP